MQSSFQHPNAASRQKISKESAELVLKNNKRALALLRALAPYQINTSDSIDSYPLVQKAVISKREAAAQKLKDMIA